MRTLGINEEWIHEIVRRKILHEQARFIHRTQTEPEKVKGNCSARSGRCLATTTTSTSISTALPALAAAPPSCQMPICSGIAAGRASVVTDEIECFTETGLLLKSGATLDADIIVTATGFHLSALGDIDFAIDGELLCSATPSPIAA